MTSTRSCGSAATALLLVAMLPLLLFHLCEIFIQTSEPLFQKAAVSFEPIGGRLERVRPKPGRPPLRLPAALDKSRFFQHPQMLRDGRPAHRKRLREF